MKFISLLVLFLSFSVVADETCRSALFDFTITRNYIEVAGQSENVRIPFHGVRTLSRRSPSDFKALLKTLSDEITTDEVLTRAEASVIERFSLTVADENEEFISIMYAKAYDKSSQIVARYILSAGNSYRCQ